MPLEALPLHMQDNNARAAGKGTDWDVWAARWIPQHWFAFGPNAQARWDFITILPVPYWLGLAKVRLWKFTIPVPEPNRWFRLVLPIPVRARWRRFPKILLGYNVSRWMGKNDETRLKVHTLKNQWIFPWTDPWAEKHTVTEERRGDEEHVKVYERTLADHGPSPIQYWSKFSFQITWPLGFAVQIQWKWSNVMQSFKRKIFARGGSRWDSGDDFHDAPSAFIGGSFN